MSVLGAKSHWLKGGLVLYRHEAGGVESSFLTLDCRHAPDENVQLLLDSVQQLQAFVNRDAWLDGAGPGGDLHEYGRVLSCDLNVGGLRLLQKHIETWRPEAGRGWDRVVVRSFPRGDVLVHGGPEAFLLEAISTGEGDIKALMVGRCSLEMAETLGRTIEVVTISTRDVIKARIDNPKLISHTGVVQSELKAGPFDVHSFYAAADRRYHWAFATHGLGQGEKAPLIRIESECLTGHVLGSQLCDCGQQMETALDKISQDGHGALIYLRQEGRGIGLVNKLKAYRLQQFEQMDTVDANLAIGVPEDARDYLIGAHILLYFGIRRCRLLTNNPAKVDGLQRYGIEIVERVPHIIPASQHNERYLNTKKQRMGHLI